MEIDNEFERDNASRSNLEFEQNILKMKEKEKEEIRLHAAIKK